MVTVERILDLLQAELDWYESKPTTYQDRDYYIRREAKASVLADMISSIRSEMAE